MAPRKLVNGDAGPKKAVRFRGVKMLPWGQYGAKIRDPWKKVRIWLGNYNNVEDAARAYDHAARVLHGPKAKTNFPSLRRRGGEEEEEEAPNKQ